MVLMKSLRDPQLAMTVPPTHVCSIIANLMWPAKYAVLGPQEKAAIPGIEAGEPKT
jgi:hypothetical protein